MVAANGNGRFLTNWDGYSSRYNGIELSLVKRMSNRWMARVGAAFNQRNEYYDAEPAARQPRQPDAGSTPSRSSTAARSWSAARAAAPATSSSTASGSSARTASTRRRAGSSSGATLFGRQGYPFPVYRTCPLGLDGSRQRVLVSPELDTFRLDDLWNLDLRAAKTFRFDRASFEVIADLFNVMNAEIPIPGPIPFLGGFPFDAAFPEDEFSPFPNPTGAPTDKNFIGGVGKDSDPMGPSRPQRRKNPQKWRDP